MTAWTKSRPRFWKRFPKERAVCVAPRENGEPFFAHFPRLKHEPKSLPLEGGRSARKMIQWIIFSEGRAAALDAVSR